MALNKKRAVQSPKRSLDFSPKTQNQKLLLESIRKNVVSFAVGSAGVGKTTVAVYAALDGLLNKRFSRVILTRAAIGVGPDIGALPGTAEEKLAPVMVPLMDEIYKLLGHELADKLIMEGVIEVSPLLFARGRNFEDAFVIVDEAENLTAKEFYLLLTRICPGTKMVFTGDAIQVDIRNSGFEDAIYRLEGREGFGVVRFHPDDCLRDPIVKSVIEAYGVSHLQFARPFGTVHKDVIELSPRQEAI